MQAACYVHVLVGCHDRELSGQVDVGSILQSLRVCSRLTHVTLNQGWKCSLESSKRVPLPMPSGFMTVSMPTVQVLEIPKSPKWLDLQACSQLHSLHITDAFQFEETGVQSRPLACIIVNLRRLSKRFKMPDGGQWGCPKGYSHYEEAHWHRPSSLGKCYLCSSVHTIHLGPSGT